MRLRRNFLPLDWSLLRLVNIAKIDGHAISSFCFRWPFMFNSCALKLLMWGGRWILRKMKVSANFLKENSILRSKNLKIFKIIDLLTNPRPRIQNYVPEVFLSQWSWYFDSWVLLKKLPKFHFFSKKHFSKNSIKHYRNGKKWKSQKTKLW